MSDGHSAVGAAPCSVLDPGAAAELARGLRALADPARLMLLTAIANAEDGEACACDLPAVIDRTAATVSHHLGILAEAGLIDREQRGKWAWFRLRSERLAELSRAIEPDRLT